MGMIEVYDPAAHGSEADFAHNVLPLGARVKPNGSVRMLVDPSLPGVNDAMVELPCTLPTVEQIFQHVKPDSMLGKRDLLNGFFHITLHPDARRYMGFRHPVTGQLCRWVVLPQGTKQSPAVFCAVSEAACRIFNKALQERGIDSMVFVYVDDFIVVADNHEAMMATFDIMDTEGAALGLTWNLKKDVGRETPMQRIEALGLLLDAAAQEMQLPSDKRERYLQDLRQFISDHEHKHEAAVKPLEQLVGRLLYVCKVCRWGYLFVQSLLDALYPGVAERTAGSQPGKVPLGDAVRYEQRFWEALLSDTGSPWSGIKKHLIGTKEVQVDPSQFDCQLYTDASMKYGVGGVLGKEVYSYKWHAPTDGVHIGTLELEALYICLLHWKDELSQQQVLARMDNIQAVVAVNKGCSRKPALRDILYRIARLGMQYNFELKAIHVKGELNPADAPSRGKRATSTQNWMFTDFAQFNSPPAEVDCCASPNGQNAQPGCHIWYSEADPVQDHARDLAGKVLWANIPFDSLTPIMGVIVQAWKLDPLGTLATVVVPDWPTAAWYRRYIRRKRPLFRLLHRYPAGSHVFTWRGSLPPHGCKHDMLVLRIGSRGD